MILREALIERWFDIDTDHHQVTDEQILARIEDLVGEGWYAAGREAERHAARVQELEDRAAALVEYGNSLPEGVSTEAFAEASNLRREARLMGREQPLKEEQT